MQEWHSVQEIVQDGNQVLRKVAKPIGKKEMGSPELKKLILHMRELLAKEPNGVGLAASQVGVPIALFIVAGKVFEEKEEGGAKSKDGKNSKGGEKESKPHPMDKIFINPELIRTSRKKKEMSEGCLSVRGKYGTVLRHEKASIKALDGNGTPITYHATGLLAHIFQHEMDHLNGVLFIDTAVSLENESKREVPPTRAARQEEYAKL